ncbi:complexed with Cdc5 protein Cwf15 [Schizosaccharomyces cryophilus OY26]|uniref:Complexed with Cdc5 protein Cwf15 n=1 Tax=Schizosaccharomyces cryophilus (strain OY26 / ATCC MYA-4695 / CBS 11777 / NBRC 106824 / NRRL Y48691) TaxID=653667 RepID=S9WXL3_SCHCR|nr:complexed with Cdc5 protein Cwf15 [Schizosaccharomyces cryophilus OY26]EPY49422.1 complexed with Cdc5 protein Cwf15 [Schizosaccharomyces cryophilus OY26]
MTTAHRPQFDPARGSSEMAPTRITASRALPAHLKLKYRKSNQGTQEELSRKDFREQLLRSEAAHFANREHGAAVDKHAEAPAAIEANPETKPNESQEKVDYEELLRKTFEEDADSSESESDSEEEEVTEGETNLPAEKRLKKSEEERSDSDSNSSSEDDDDEEDETAQLLRELENIKQERQKEKEKQELEAQREEEEKREKEIAYGNILLNQSSTGSFQVKRRWDEDVVFKNTHKGIDDQPKQGFINDMLRSDFHKKFLARFVQ